MGSCRQVRGTSVSLLLGAHRCVCVGVCVRERERERVCEGVQEWNRR